MQVQLTTNLMAVELPEGTEINEDGIWFEEDGWQVSITPDVIVGVIQGGVISEPVKSSILQTMPVARKIITEVDMKLYLTLRGLNTSKTIAIIKTK